MNKENSGEIDGKKKGRGEKGNWVKVIDRKAALDIRIQGTRGFKWTNPTLIQLQAATQTPHNSHCSPQKPQKIKKKKETHSRTEDAKITTVVRVALAIMMYLSVATRGRGFGLLDNHDRALDILSTVVADTPKKCPAKIRRPSQNKHH